MAEPNFFPPSAFQFLLSIKSTFLPRTMSFLESLMKDTDKKQKLSCLSRHPLQISSFGGTLYFCSESCSIAACHRTGQLAGRQRAETGGEVDTQTFKVSQRKSRRRALVPLFVFATLTPPLFELRPNSTWVCAGGLNLRARSNDQKCIVQ